MSDYTTDVRRCNICDEEYPETAEYFYRGKGNKDGLLPTCKSCHGQIRSALREAKIERNRSEGYEVPVVKQCSICSIEHPATPEYFYPRKEAKDGLRKECRKCFDTKQNQWKAENPERVKENSRKGMARARERNRDKIYARTREWKARNKDKIRAHRDANRDKYTIYDQRRRQRVAGRLEDLTPEQWQAAIDFFGGCCAYCGRPPDLFRVLCVEHFIPISSPDCPGTTASNCLPACSGLDGCNNKKHTKNPETWIVKTFGKSKGAKILKRIKDYFDTVALAKD